MRGVILSAVLVLAANSPAQWSEPQIVADGVSLWAAGPALARAGSDSLWAVWASGEWPQLLRARCLAGDSWQAVEPVVGDSWIGAHWPAAVVDDSGRLLVACYIGDYPTDGSPYDTWGIYTVTRGTGGWEEPVLAHDMMMEAFPVELQLGLSHAGTVGMAWSEDFGRINSMDSVMFSRRTPTGWTERKCLAPGRYPDVRCHGPTLVAGDSTDFCLAFARWTYPACTVHVLALEDTVVSAPTSFSGSAPGLARDAERKVLVFVDQGRVLGSEDRGSGWSAPVEIAAGTHRWAGLPVCIDAQGVAWTCWYDSLAGYIKASYNRGHGWTEPETIAAASSWLTLKLAADGFGKVHCLWVDNSTLKHAYRVDAPGVADRPIRAKGRALSTVLRGPELVRLDCRVIDALGRDVTGRRDRLTPGIYFLRSAEGREPSAVRKVLIQR